MKLETFVICLIVTVVVFIGALVMNQHPEAVKVTYPVVTTTIGTHAPPTIKPENK